MSRRIFDFDDGDYINFSGGNIGIDSDSNTMMRMSDNLSLDLDSGELHFTSSWNDEDDDY